MLKIITLNIFRYYQDWNKRKQAIIKYLKKEKPDMVFLQECFDDQRHNEPDQHQAKQLNDILNFEHCIYSVAEMVRSERNVALSTATFDGLACLSSIPITEVNTLRLKKQDDDKHFRIIQRIVTSLHGETMIFYHVHFSNRNDWAREHLKETLQLANKEKIRPIIIGDFNIKIIDDVLSLGRENYIVSWAIHNYISFPSENETFDYILIPKNWSFKHISCNVDDLSDHLPLLATVKKRS